MSVRAGFLAGGVPLGIASREAPLAAAAMLERSINDQNESRMFIAQVLHESVGLRYFEEIASGEEYEGRADLGNTHPGDGPRYKGRSPIQLTGRANYRAYGHALGLPLEQHPELAAEHKNGWRIAALFWSSHGLNQLADQGDFLTITKRINGGTNGLASREQYLRLVSRVDCRPAPPDPLEHLTPTERRWCHEYDHLKAHNQNPARRRVLQRVMTAQRQRIWREAHKTGWDHLYRRQRYRSLLARTS